MFGWSATEVEVVAQLCHIFLLDACKLYQEKENRVQIQEYEVLVYPGLTVHALYVKYLLPTAFDVQSMERT